MEDLLKINEDDQICSICMMEYNNQTETPMKFCSHNHIVCQKCLWLMLIEGEAELSCPYRKEKIEKNVKYQFPQKKSKPNLESSSILQNASKKENEQIAKEFEKTQLSSKTNQETKTKVKTTQQLDLHRTKDRNRIESDEIPAKNVLSESKIQGVERVRISSNQDSSGKGQRKIEERSRGLIASTGMKISFSSPNLSAKNQQKK